MHFVHRGHRAKTDRIVTFYVAASSVKICFEKNASELTPLTCLFTTGKLFT